MLAKEVAQTVSIAADVHDVLTKFDTMIRRGIAGQALRLSEDFFAEHRADLAALDDEHFIDQIATVDDPITRALIENALIIFAQIAPIADRLQKTLSPDAVREAERERDTRPMGYLTACPVPVARLMLAGDRGILGACAVFYEVEHPGALAPWQMREAARLWRDGLHATACLYASLVPDEVPEDLVAPSGRLDLGALAELRREEDELIARIAAAHPNDNQFYLYDTDV